MNHGYPPAGRGWYLAIVLMLALTFSHVDRSLLALLAEPIRKDFGMNDSQIGLLHAGFGLFSGLAAFPIARLIDSASRRLVIAAGLFLWTGATALTAVAGSFAGLFAARSAVSIGEAALMPGATSMLADSFPADRRAMPMGVFTIGIYLGSAAALVVGGFLNRAFETGRLPLLPGTDTAWQSVFLSIGLAGLLLLPLLGMAREPPRQGAGSVSIPIAQVFAFGLVNRRALAGHMLGFTMMGLAANSVGAWVPALFMRQFQWTTSELGLAFGLVLLLVGPGGSVVGGAIADRLTRAGRNDAPLLVGMLSAIGAAPLALGAGLAASGTLCMLFLSGFFFFVSFNWALAVTSLAAIVPNRMRAQSVAVYLAVSNIVGAGLGPLLLAVVSDHLGAGSGNLQRAIVIVIPAAVVCGALLLGSARASFARMSRDAGESRPS
jgi:MFS family permease